LGTKGTGPWERVTINLVLQLRPAPPPFPRHGSAVAAWAREKVEEDLGDDDALVGTAQRDRNSLRLGVARCRWGRHDNRREIPNQLFLGEKGFIFGKPHNASIWYHYEHLIE